MLGCLRTVVLVRVARLTLLCRLCSVLGMTNTGLEMECTDCGHIGTPDEFEIHTYIGARRKKFQLPRCIDRKACAVRVKEETARLHADIAQEVAEVAHGLALTRQAVKDAEVELAEAIKDALSEGVGATQVARAAGISRERVYQIRDGRR